jgi:hypothetical protein
LNFGKAKDHKEWMNAMKDRNGNLALISLYVDDLIITRSAIKLIDEIKR